jgi:hypothetical protein
MKYFKITQNTDSKIIGKYPQVKDLKINFHEARASQWGKIDEWKSDDDIPDLNNFLLHPKSKLTDCLSNNFVFETSGLIMSSKCKQILDSFSVNGKFYTATVYKSDEEIYYDYYFLHYEMSSISKINFKKSSFIEYNISTLEVGNIVLVEDFEDYKEKVESLRVSKNDEIALWDLFPKSIHLNHAYDLTPMFKLGLICNENIKKVIEENQLTGFDFRPIDVEILFE